jgi:RNA polymerase sigma-70 factor (ECF subfamily)
MQSAAVTLYYFEDRAIERVAEALGLPENTVKTHLFRARAALREAWTRDEAEGSDELRRD